MPLSNFQTEIPRLLASHRDPESYVGGSTPLSRNTLRYSGDIDVCHDREERIAETAMNDGHVLESAGFTVTWLRQVPSIYTAQTDKAGLLLLENGKIVQPDPDHLDRYRTDAGQRRGHWPATAEITSAMIENSGHGQNI